MIYKHEKNKKYGIQLLNQNISLYNAHTGDQFPLTNNPGKLPRQMKFWIFRIFKVTEKIITCHQNSKIRAIDKFYQSLPVLPPVFFCLLFLQVTLSIIIVTLKEFFKDFLEKMEFMESHA